jgi:23S rRNA (cytosine1962-C5)-methyltransferase
MTGLPDVKVNRKAAGRVASGHPWIFASDVTDQGDAAPGDAVRVTDPAARVVGTALYSSSSQIMLRMISPRIQAVDRAFFLQRIGAAIAYRERVVSNTDSFRLVYSEADQLPGLIVDRYGDSLVLQALNQGMDRATPLIVECLRELCQPQSIVARNDVTVRTRESLPVEKKVLFGDPPSPVHARMNGYQFRVDLLGGQKTGIYLDQRENYAAAAKWARGRALDCFTSTGGFAIHTASRCESVEAVDSSEPALATATANAEVYGIANMRCIEADVFDLLSGHASAGRRFDTIVLDPPAFTKSRSNIEAAMRGYKEINRRAIALLNPGGVLITCSCSHHVSEAALLEVVAEAGLDTNRTLRVVERRTQSLDHPILLTVPETHYLKCLILEAMIS